MNKYPQVLLIGNGINRAYGGDSWTGILKRISKRNDIPIDDLKSPMPLQAVLVTNNDIKTALDSHKKLFYGSINVVALLGFRRSQYNSLRMYV